MENFHSDILASLVDPSGLHHQKDGFLQLFIQFLNQHYQTAIANKDFEHAIVIRETGRIDIWIRDEKSKQSIIIENKITNAPDMYNQLDRYFDYAENCKYSVQAMVYLSVDGNKKAPATLDNRMHLVKNIGAFTNTESDLGAGWLAPCLNRTDNRAASSFLFQYISLIKHLANKNMKTNIMEQFYQFLSTNNGMEAVNSISEMRDKITAYRRDVFANAITDFSPFKIPCRHKDNYYLYDNYMVKNNSLKLDIWFEMDGSANVLFWNQSKPTKEGRKPLEEKLKAINFLSEFEQEHYRGSGFLKKFEIGKIYQSMSDVDTAVIEFVKRFLEKLRNSD
ncbi:PD-(D/E)XK nuclease family protein [Maribellus sp. YY47]|nr:PD-(D/E)XK nuclease family protein [Maribellus sp. YY47]